ncbi:pirin family protein [Puia sp. P3]|uniref:pirin family protein n=1 Tax=Puia sp. P3 TaxID=3423952 RepID=UPI003D6750C7
MTNKFYPASERGHVNFGWLDSHHSFSFGNWHDREKVHFGALRVLNDDVVVGGGGFDNHPHENMEIISIPLKGALSHKDSTGTEGFIYTNDVQVMSAGSGISHSEYNASHYDAVQLSPDLDLSETTEYQTPPRPANLLPGRPPGPVAGHRKPPRRRPRALDQPGRPPRPRRPQRRQVAHLHSRLPRQRRVYLPAGRQRGSRRPPAATPRWRRPHRNQRRNPDYHVLPRKYPCDRSTDVCVVTL